MRGEWLLGIDVHEVDEVLLLGKGGNVLGKCVDEVDIFGKANILKTSSP